MIPLLSVAFIPLAMAQQAPSQPVITIGENYDLIEDYQSGIATWQSHTERIFDGTDWKDFIVYDRNSIVQVESNSIGSLIYDKDSCSYSIYENGYVTSGTQIIPAVSWMPRIAEVGTDNYSEMTDLFNQQCDVQVRQGEDWVKITSVKTQTVDIDPLVVLHANGTTSTYPSGTRDIATVTQTLDIKTTNGIKETVSVYNGNPNWNNHKFALSQTVHTGDSITLGDQTYDIAAASGTVLDRSWIENNEAEIFEIADSLSYDFDVGIQQLNAIQILNDGTNKVSMDFSVNESTPYLTSYTVDPTFTTTGSGTFDITALHGGGSIVTGLIDGVTLTSGQISSLQSDINATNQYHTLAGTTLTVYYSVPTAPSAPANLSAVSGIPITLDWDASTDLGGAATGDMTYKVERSDYEFAQSELPDNAGSDSAVNMSTNVLLYHLNEMATSPSNHIEDTSGANNDSENPNTSTTVTLSTPSHDGSQNKSNNGSTCTGSPTGGSISASNYIDGGSSGNPCYRTYMEWDISGISDSATITSVSVIYNISANNGAIYDIYSMETTTANESNTSTALWDDMTDGDLYADDQGGGTGSVTIDLGATAATNLQSDLASKDVFGIGLSKDPENSGSRLYKAFDAAESATPPQLVIEYGDTVDRYYHIGTQPDGATNPLAIIDELHIHSDAEETLVDKAYDRGNAEYQLVDTIAFNEAGAQMLYADTSVVAGDAPIYKISSYNLLGESELQTLVQGLTVQLSNAPTNLAASSTVNADIQLSWTASTDLGGGSLSDYELQRRTPPTTGTWITVNNPTTTAYLDTNVNTGTTYEYQVASNNEAGTGVYSSPVSQQAGTPPDPPTYLLL